MIEVKGADQLAAVAKALKAAGDKDLQREMYRGINNAVKPIKAAIRESEKENLPRRGGLAASVGKGKLLTRRRSSSRTSGVRIVAKSKHSLYHLNQGIVRHPTRQRGVYTIQRIRPGFWTEPTEENAEEARREVEKVLNDIMAKLERAARA